MKQLMNFKLKSNKNLTLAKASAWWTHLRVIVIVVIYLRHCFVQILLVFWRRKVGIARMPGRQTLK